MSMLIKDGTGNGYTARVDSENALQISGPVLSHIAHESQKDGTAFCLTTGGFIALTATNADNAVLYIKNTDEKQRPFCIERIRICGGGAMGAHAMMKILIHANVTGGTIVSDAVAGSAAIANFAFRNEFEGDVYSGGDNKTATGGTFFTQMQCHINGETTNEYYSALALGKGNSLAIFVRPEEACDVCIEIFGYYETYALR